MTESCDRRKYWVSVSKQTVGMGGKKVERDRRQKSVGEETEKRTSKADHMKRERQARIPSDAGRVKKLGHCI